MIKGVRAQAYSGHWKGFAQVVISVPTVKPKQLCVMITSRKLLNKNDFRALNPILFSWCRKDRHLGFEAWAFVPRNPKPLNPEPKWFRV